MKLNFLVEKNDQIIFKGYKLEIFIPKEFFRNNIAEHHGNEIETIGMFIIRYYHSKNDKDGRLFQCTLPEGIRFEFSDTYEKDISFDNSKDVEKHEVFVLENNDVFLNTVNLTQFFQNTEKLINLHHTGKIPEVIPYGEIINLYMDSMRVNDSSLRMPSLLLEMIISELARLKTDLDIPFRKEIGKNSTRFNERDYLQLSILNLARQNSTFTAITSEDMNKSIISSINKTHKDGSELETPIEKTIKY